MQRHSVREAVLKNWDANFPYNVRFKANLALERGKVLKLPAMRMLSTLITLIIFPLFYPPRYSR